MNRPFKQYYQAGEQLNLTIGANAAEKIPDLAAKAAKIFAISADIEYGKSGLLVELLSADREAATEMYFAIRSAQTAAIKSLLRLRYNTKETDKFSEILSGDKTFQKHRNRFAHWQWAACDQYPDLLILIQPKDRQISVSPLLDKSTKGSVTKLDSTLASSDFISKAQAYNSKGLDELALLGENFKASLQIAIRAARQKSPLP